MYVPRAKRSQTTPPASTLSIDQISPKSQSSKKSTKTKSKSIDENHSTSNSEESNDPIEVAINQSVYGSVTCDRLNQSEATLDCDLFNGINCRHQELVSGEAPTDEKNQKNLSNLSTMNEQAKVLTIESAGGMNGAEADKVDKDEKELKELMRASQEINRSNRKLIKQTFNSNVLEIEATGGGAEDKTEEKAVSKDDDDWDTL